MDPQRQTVPTMTPREPAPTEPGGDDEEEEPGPETPPAQPSVTPTPSAQSTVSPQPTELSSSTPLPPPTVSPSPRAASPTPSAGWDFGDAPDPGFPSLLASEGARHFMVQSEWLGKGVDQELDSRQVGADLYDDGVEVGELLTCKQAELQVVVSVANRDDPQHPYDGQHLLYLNALVDWDGDGSWGGTVLCPGGLAAPEWAIRNLPVDVSAWPQGVTSTVVPVQFVVGPQAGEAWARFTLSYGQVISGDDWDGRGAFTFGETEDHLVTISPSPTATTVLPAAEAIATMTPTPMAVLVVPGGAGWWPSLLCLSSGLLLGIALVAIWAAKRRRASRLLVGGLISIAVFPVVALLYWGSHFSSVVLVAERDSPTVPPTPHERLIPTRTPRGRSIAEPALSNPEFGITSTPEPATPTPNLITTPTPEAQAVIPTPRPSVMAVRQRFGFGAPVAPLDQFAVEQLRAGWYYVWRTDPNPVRPQGMEFVQMIRVRGTSFSPTAQNLQTIIRNNPGSLWIVGNEPDIIWQDNTTATDYAQVYHEVYSLLKSNDPTCQVAIAGVSQSTPLRLQYLDMVLEAYHDLYGQMIPVDVWNVHGFILREERGSWGADIPPGITVNQGRLYEIEDHDDMDIFVEQIVGFRRWMRDRGQRDKPLIVSEYGILMPAEYGFPYEGVRDFMYASFDYFLTAADDSLGYPADGNRLVQRWAWYSLSDTVYPTGNLFDPDTGLVTPLGLAYGSYAPSV